MICINKFLGPCDSDANKVTITILRPPRHHNRHHFSIFVMTQDVLASIIHSSPRGLTLGKKFFILNLGRPCLVSCYSERCLKQPGGAAPWWQSLGITIERRSCILVDKVPAVSNHNSVCPELLSTVGEIVQPGRDSSKSQPDSWHSYVARFFRSELL